ncbi:MAG: hypothetical protein ACRCWO_11890 [Bosea sp. (in: a-proteobacteria)]
MSMVSLRTIHSQEASMSGSIGSGSSNYSSSWASNIADYNISSGQDSSSLTSTFSTGSSGPATSLISPAVGGRPPTSSTNYFDPKAEQLSPLIGKPVAEVLAGLRELGATDVRNGDLLVTADFVEGRVTYQTDGNGNVTRISVEGGVAVSNASTIDLEPTPQPIYFNSDLSKLDGLVGLDRSQADAFLATLGASNVRFVGPEGFVTPDYSEGRITITLDAAGLVTGSSVEGDQGFATSIAPPKDVPIPDPEPEPVFKPTRAQIDALIGQGGAAAATALTNLGTTDIRIIGPDTLFTADFVNGRASIYVDENGVVTRIKIEGGEDTIRAPLPN